MKDSEQLRKLRELQKKKHVLTHNFTWPMLNDITPEEAEEYMMIKGVAMTEGELKSGENITAENLIAGAGAMRAAALMGAADIDIDHFEEKLPEEYEKEFGAEINDPYPPAFIFDAQAVKNTVEPAGKEMMQVEFLGVCTNRHVYEMIRDNRFKGCSVVDYVRNLNCESNKGACDYEGSAFMVNTLVLKQVPNSDATWVDVVSAKDVGTIISNNQEKKDAESHTANRLQTRLQNHIDRIRNVAKDEGDELGDYMTDGVWNDGAASAEAFLREQKGIEEKLAHDMAGYLLENPRMLTQYQLEWMSDSDLVAWWNTVIETQGMKKQIDTLRKNVATLSWLEHNAQAIAAYRKVRLAVPFGQGEVGYGEATAPEQCKNCRWFSPYDLEEPDESDGMCAIVAGDVNGMMGCEKFESNPAMPDPMQPADPEDPDADPADPGEDPEMPMELEPDEHGNCPDGYAINGEGTMCVRTDARPAERQSEAVPEHGAGTARHLKRHGQVEKNPVKNTAEVAAELDAQITKIRTQIRRMSVVFPGRQNVGQQAELEKLRKELHRLEELKKKC